MTSNSKLLVGILSFIPFTGLIVYLVYFFSFFFGAILHEEPPAGDPGEFVLQFIPLFIILGITSVVGLGMFIYLLICAIKDVSATENDKILWILLIVFLSYLIFPFYWYFRIWKNPDFSLNNSVKTDYTN